MSSRNKLTDRSTGTWILVALALGGLLGLVAFFFPYLQALGYALLIANPAFLQWGIVGALFGAAALKLDSPGLFWVGASVFFIMGLVVGPVIGGVYAHEDMANQVEGNAEKLETLPNTSKENVRVLPRSVSDNYAQSSMQYPQYQLTGSDITYRNGSYTWSHGIVPDNFMVALMGNQHGALYVNMTTTQKDVNVKETTFKNGRGQMWFDSYTYQSTLHTPLKDHRWQTSFNARANGTSYIAHSTVTHEWRFRLLPIPQLYAVPQHGSVEVMTADGEIDSLSPQEARNSELLRGQNYYPYDLAMFKVTSMQYTHGALNKWFWKEDVLSIADLPEQGNSWPIAVPTEGEKPELTYFVATEPTGSGNGVYEIWTIDGQTGEMGVQQYDDSQIGPQKAVDFVERRPQVNRLSNANAVAPVPVVKGDSLFWHVKVVPKSNSGIVYTAFVNAQSGDVTLVDGDKPIYAFLTQEELESVQNQTKSGENGMTVTVVVTDSNGKIVGTRNVTVPEGGGVKVAVNRSNNSTPTA